MKRNHQKEYLHMAAAGIAAAICIAMIIFPAEAINSARKGVAIWMDTVLPALLPFFICANFMAVMGIPKLIGKAFDGAFQKVFDVSGVSAFVFFASATSGYPMGAMLIGDMARRKDISAWEAKSMLTFCSTSGPLFMLGAVGVGMLGSPKAGYVIAISHYMAAVINGIAWRTIRKGEHTDKRSHCISTGNLGKRLNPAELLTQSILSALRTVGIICCYLVLFTMISDFLMLSRIFRWLENDFWMVWVSGILEMTVGCHQMSLLDAGSFTLKIVLCSFFISFGGLSIMAQSMSLLSGTGISSLYYFCIKITHGVVAAAISFLICFLLPHLVAETAVVSMDGGGMIKIMPGYLHQFLFSLNMISLLIVIFVCTVIADRLYRWYNSTKGKRDGVK